jgi:hypothetical protein
MANVMRFGRLPHGYPYLYTDADHIQGGENDHEVRQASRRAILALHESSREECIDRDSPIAGKEADLIAANDLRAKDAEVFEEAIIGLVERTARTKGGVHVIVRSRRGGAHSLTSNRALTSAS